MLSAFVEDVAYADLIVYITDEAALTTEDSTN